MFRRNWGKLKQGEKEKEFKWSRKPSMRKLTLEPRTEMKTLRVRLIQAEETATAGKGVYLVYSGNKLLRLEPSG